MALLCCLLAASRLREATRCQWSTYASLGLPRWPKSLTKNLWLRDWLDGWTMKTSRGRPRSLPSQGTGSRLTLGTRLIPKVTWYKPIQGFNWRKRSLVWLCADLTELEYGKKENLNFIRRSRTLSLFSRFYRVNYHNLPSTSIKRSIYQSSIYAQFIW